jgi:hypothetical protein
VRPEADVLRERIGALLDLMGDPQEVVVYDPLGAPWEGRVVSSWVDLDDGWHVLPPREGAPPAIVDLGSGDSRGLVLFDRDGWELRRWNEPLPRERARCLCPEAGTSEMGPC